MAAFSAKLVFCANPGLARAGWLAVSVAMAVSAAADEVSATAAMVTAFEARCIAPMMAGEVPELTGAPSPEDPSIPWNGYGGVIVQEAGEKIYGQSFARNGYAGCTMVLAYHGYQGGGSADPQLAAFADRLLGEGFAARGACDLDSFSFQKVLYSTDRPLNGNHVVVLVANGGGFTPFLVAGESDEGYLPPCEETSG